MSWRNDTALNARKDRTASHSQPDFGVVWPVRTPGPPPAGTLCGYPPVGGFGFVVMTGAGDVVTGAGEVVTGAGEVVTGAGDVVTGAGDVVIDVGVGVGDVVVGVGVGDVVVGVGVGDVVVGVGLGLGFGGLQPRFQMAWPAPSQL